ncbi:hypothetical protein BaRGS_00013386 [Batillaria attramentaria]|uniref:Uncharacterized protein n=1 Tax=Batillaria attramentaria TaxID=370345 RepID=A0ABD0L8E8_9CAEN
MLHIHNPEISEKKPYPSVAQTYSSLHPAIAGIYDNHTLDQNSKQHKLRKCQFIYRPGSLLPEGGVSALEQGEECVPRWPQSEEINICVVISGDRLRWGFIYGGPGSDRG